MLYAYPLTGAAPLDAEMIHLRTLLAGIESLKSGVTTILDDVMEVPHQGLEQLGSVFGAYEQIGMRANVSGHVINRPFFETIPYLEESLPDRLREKFLRVPPIGLSDYMDFCSDAVVALSRERRRSAAVRRRAVRAAAVHRGAAGEGRGLLASVPRAVSHPHPRDEGPAGHGNPAVRQEPDQADERPRRPARDDEHRARDLDRRRRHRPDRDERRVGRAQPGLQPADRFGDRAAAGAVEGRRQRRARHRRDLQQRQLPPVRRDEGRRDRAHPVHRRLRRVADGGRDPVGRDPRRCPSGGPRRSDRIDRAREEGGSGGARSLHLGIRSGQRRRQPTRVCRERLIGAARDGRRRDRRRGRPVHEDRRNRGAPRSAIGPRRVSRGSTSSSRTTHASSSRTSAR